VVTGPRTVEVTSDEGTETLEGRFVLIATGSVPAIPAIPGIAEVPVLTNETLYDLTSPPSDIIIIGAGPVGVESAQALARIGAKVQLFETGPRILPREEPQLSERLTDILRNDGVDVHVGEPILAARYENGRCYVETVRGELDAEHLLVAAGRSSSVTSLGLDRLGIVATPAGINVDARSRTVLTSIYAVGDAAAGRPRLTSTAVADASLAIRDMFLPGRAQASTMSPWCIFTEPELARVGFTAAQAKERFRSRAVKVHQLELSEVHRALFEGSSEGLIEIVTVHGRIVGGHVIASRASEVINEIALAVRFSVSIEELARVPHVYPTIASGIGRLASDQAVLRLRRLKGFAKLGRLTG
ncbi:MAG: dihydrolipoyl dehydrogenase family protein, partial [Ilumatobacteraceae bacterium]